MADRDNICSRSWMEEREAIQRGINQLQTRLPQGWGLELGRWEGKPREWNRAVDALVGLKGPDQRGSDLRVEYKSRIDPRGVFLLARQMEFTNDGTHALLMAPYLSSPTQKALREARIGYLDFTGNIWLSVTSPGLFIEVEGAKEDPNRENRPARSLKGTKAARLVRTLLDRKELLGIRGLATEAGVDPGYASRVISLLESEAIVDRTPRGGLAKVDWEKLLRRWGQESPFEKRGRQVSFIEPRGLPGVMNRLQAEPLRYAITGGMAANQWAPITSPRLLTIYVDEVEMFAKGQGLRPSETGINVLLIQPTDEYVYQKAEQRDGIWYAAPSQVAADLLTSPGRGPAEGEELIEWMRMNEGAWRG